ncbi:MAG TPA: hypothetical protein VF590_12110 [Isosphaeraceae bacterium]|jgi:hypothetical protein
MLTSIRRKWGDAAQRPDRRPRRLCLGLENLEARVVLTSIAPIVIQVNTNTHLSHTDSDNASSANGMSVVVWTDWYSSTDTDIRAQLYDSSRGPLGPEIIVDGSVEREGSPAVAMDNQGHFVVTWARTHADGNADVMARKYDALGTSIGGIFAVANTSKSEYDPDVAMSATGNFVVSYTLDFSASDQDIQARQYLWNASVIPWHGTISVATSGRNESRSSVASAADGRFSIAYQLQYSSADDDIRVNRYSASGDLLGAHVVAASGDREQAPSLSMDDYGGAVVAYQRWAGGNVSIKAKRLTSSGSLGDEINVSSGTTGATSPSVALRRKGGAFVVAYESGGVNFTEISATNTVIRTFYSDAEGYSPAISLDGLDRFLLTYTGPWVDPTTGEVDRYHPEIYGQKWELSH